MIKCKSCEEINEGRHSGELRAWTCSDCTQKLVDGIVDIVSVPQEVPKIPVDWPRGWHKRKHFVGPSGEVYSRGKLVTEDLTVN